MRILCAAEHCSDKYLRHDDEFLAREVELLDRLPEDDLGQPVGVHGRCVECLDAAVISTVRPHRSQCVSLLRGESSRGTDSGEDLRVFNVLDRLLFLEHPLLPLRAAIGHATEDDS